VLPFVLVGLIAVLDVLLLLKFVPLYFQFGIPVYRRKITVNGAGQTPGTAEAIEEQLPTSAWPGFALREIGRSEYAFRERLFGGGLLTYTPIMHGTITFDARTGLVIVMGRLNWLPIALFTYLIASFGEASDSFFIAIGLLIAVVIYLIQAVRFSQVADSAATLWASTSSTRRPEIHSGALGDRSSPPGSLGLARILTGLVAGIGAVLLVRMMFLMANSEDPYPDLAKAYPATKADSVALLSPPSVEFTVDNLRKSSRYRGSMKLALSPQEFWLVPTFPSSLFRKNVAIPLGDISGCGSRYWGGGERDALVLIERTATEISVENSPESKLVFAWCAENGLPMMSEHELDVWRHKGAPLVGS